MVPASSGFVGRKVPGSGRGFGSAKKVSEGDSLSHRLLDRSCGLGGTNGFFEYRQPVHHFVGFLMDDLELGRKFPSGTSSRYGPVIGSDTPSSSDELFNSRPK
jgi:hypothetical protein